MTSWNYRIIKQDGVYTVREVMYDKEPHSWTKDEISPHGETREELRDCLTMYINDIIFQPILVVEGDKIVGEEAPLSELLTLKMLNKEL